MALTDDQRREVGEQIELYLNRSLSRILDEAFSRHNQHCGAHSGIVKRFERFKWLLIGLAAGGGAGAGAGLVKLLGSIL